MSCIESLTSFRFCYFCLAMGGLNAAILMAVLAVVYKDIGCWSTWGILWSLAREFLLLWTDLLISVFLLGCGLTEYFFPPTESGFFICFEMFICTEFLSVWRGLFLFTLIEDYLELSPVTVGALGPSTDRYAAYKSARSVIGLTSWIKFLLGVEGWLVEYLGWAVSYWTGPTISWSNFKSSSLVNGSTD